jgi:hypothetical protein
MSERELAIATVRRIFGLSEPARRRLVEALVKTGCAACGLRVPIDERAIRRVLGSTFVFHHGCADSGALALRAAARTPQAYARRREAREAIDAARWRGRGRAGI